VLLNVHVNIERILILLRSVIQLYKTICYRIRASRDSACNFLRIAICEFNFLSIIVDSFIELKQIESLQLRHWTVNSRVHCTLAMYKTTGQVEINEISSDRNHLKNFW